MLAAFQGGNLVVLRVGDGVGALVNTGNPVFVDEYTPSGALVQSIAVPTVDSGLTHALVASGTATSEGGLTRSADGQYLVFAGYDASPGGLVSLSSTGASLIPRTVARVDVDGIVDTTTALTDYSDGNNPRSAITSNGIDFWVDGGAGGVRYFQLNPTTPPTTSLQITGSPPVQANLRALSIFDGQLYVGTQRGPFILAAVGSGLPTTANQVFNPLPGALNPNAAAGSINAHFFAHLNAADPGTGPDTVYITADAAGNPAGQIQKFSLVGGSWVASGTVAAPGIRGLTGVVNGSTVSMYGTTGGAGATGGGSLYSFTDTTGYNGSMTGTVTTVLSLPLDSNQAFRGIDCAPNVAPTLISGVSSLSSINEDVLSNGNLGNLVAQLIGGLGSGQIMDSAGAKQGIAITAADAAHGTWQFSLDDGASWQPFGAVSNNAALTLASDASTRIRFLPDADFFGTVDPGFTFRAWDQSTGANGAKVDASFNGSYSAFSSDTATARITVTSVNDAPGFARGPSQSISVDAGTQTIANWARSISTGAGNEAQALNFVVDNDNPAIFSMQPSISASGTLTFAGATGATGTATVTVRLHDDGGTANGGADTSAIQTFQIAISPIGGNQPPVNSIPFAAQSIPEDASLSFSAANGNLISIGDPDAGSASVEVTLTVTGGTVALSGINNLTGSGDGSANLHYSGTIADWNAALAGLEFTPPADLSGVGAAQIALTTNDLGNTGVGGAQSATDNIAIDIAPVNDVPAFTRGPDQTVDENVGLQTISGWASGISAGPADEASQALNFIVANDNNGLFAVQPSVAADGTLSYRPALNANGTALVTVKLHDDGGTANDGVDTSAVQTFLINVNAVNQPPVNSVPGAQREIKDTPLIFSATEFNQISVSDVDAFANPEQVTLSATHGTLSLATIAGLSLSVGTGTNDATMTFDGTLTAINAALNGLTFTPTAGFTGAAAVQITTDDLGNSGSGGPRVVGPTTVDINVVPTPALVISELFHNPPGLDEPNEYIEFRSTTPNYTIPDGTYLVTIAGNPHTVNNGGTLTDYPTGTVFDTFDLSGKTTGSNGFLVLLQKDNTYRLNNLVDPNAAVYDNSDYIGSGAGFGNNLAAPGSSPIGHSSIFRATGDADFIKPSASYFLIQTDNPVNPGDMLDSPLDVPPTGVLHGAEFESWHVLDSIGAVDDGTTTPGEVAYAYLNFSDKRGTTNTFTPNSTVVPGPFTPAYVGRVGNTLGSVASDWVATDHLTGLVPIWGLGAPLTTTPASFGIRPLNHLGSANFDDSQPAVVATTPSTLNYTAGSGAIAIDTNVNVSDPDSYFLGGATVAITGNFDSTKDTLAFTNTAQIAATYSASTGVLTLSGVDTFDNYIAALRSVTYANSSTASAQPARTVSFSANDGAVLSNVATRVINIQASGAAAPVVGSAGAVLAYTENAAPTVISTGLTVTDAGATQILSATVSLGATYFAGQDELAVAPNFGITGSFNAGSGVLFLTGTASVANYQAILRTVTYFNSSDNPVTTARKATFAVVDADNTSSSTSPASASRAINITAVNDAPTIAMSAGAANYTAGNPASIVDPSLTAIDPDHANLTGAAVAITGNFSSGDELHFTNQLGITGSYNASTGVLTLTGASSVANYQTALRSVSYSNALAIPSAAARTISISATDGLLTSTPATKQISVEVVLQLTVVNTNDSGPGSLRQAILYANSDLGHPHTIDFDIPGGDLHVIQLASTLPDLASALTLLVSASEAIEIGTASAFSLGAFATLTKDGPGTLTIEHNQPNASPAVLNVSAGTLHLNGDGGSNLTVNDNATLKLGASQHLASLSIAAGATASLAAGGGRVLVTPSLSITSGGALDLANNDLVVQAFSATRAAVLTEVTGLVASGAANLSWAGLGINSSAAASDPASLTALGVMLNDNGSGGPFYTSFAGETVDENDILVKYTYYGDADLSGSVDGTDYALIDNGFNAARTGWFKGDFDYASLVDGTDYALIDNAFNSQSGPLSNVGVGPVPRAALPPLPDQDQKLVDFAIASIDIITDQERFEHIGPADDILALLAIGLKRRWRR